MVCILICNCNTRAHFFRTHFCLEQAALLYQSVTHNLVQLSMIDNFFSGKTVKRQGGRTDNFSHPAKLASPGQSSLLAEPGKIMKQKLAAKRHPNPLSHTHTHTHIFIIRNASVPTYMAGQTQKSRVFHTF